MQFSSVAISKENIMEHIDKLYHFIAGAVIFLGGKLFYELCDYPCNCNCNIKRSIRLESEKELL